MTKQEKIKEGIARIGFERGLGTLAKFYDGVENIPAELLQVCWDDEMGWATYQIDNLHSEGVVIQVDGDYIGCDGIGSMGVMSIDCVLLKAGYVAVVPLIEGV